MNTFPNWLNQRFFKYTISTLLVLMCIFLFHQVAFLVKPILGFISILSAPIILSFLFYYLFRPFVLFFERRHVPRPVSIVIIYLIGTILLSLAIAYIGPILSQQIQEFIDVSLEMLEKMRVALERGLMHTFNVYLADEVRQRFAPLLQQITGTLSQNILSILALLTRIATILVVTPFIVFYLLKDDQQFLSYFLKSFPKEFTLEVSGILRNIDTTLSNYIYGVITVSSAVGTLLLIGYASIGLHYPLILSVLAMILETIPFLGPFLSLIPAILIGAGQGSFMVLKVLIVFGIVQLMESNLITPYIIGQRLHIHPLTILLLLLAAGSLYGLLGLLLATPTYAVLKVVSANLYKIYRLRYPSSE